MIADVDVSTTGDGGIVLEFTRPFTERQVAIVMPADRSTIFFSARVRGERISAGVARSWAGVEKLVDWMQGGQLCADDLIEGEDRSGDVRDR